VTQLREARTPLTTVGLRQVVRVGSASVVAASTVTLAVCSTLLGIGTGALQHVDPRAGRMVVYPVLESGASIVGILAILALAAAACPGLTTRWTTPHRIAHGVGGVVVVLGTWFGHTVSTAVVFAAADTTCRYEGCWPMTMQTFAAAAPTALLGAAMVTAALVRLPWMVRRWSPVALWVVLLTVQRALWDPVLLPLFMGPPR
jgi:hypothetical protein